MILSVRMQAVASMVSPGLKVADIGTDHAYIPIYLVSEGISPSALAMDLRDGPLLSAEKNIAEHGLSSIIKTRLSDGMDALREYEAESVIISGMGGMLMVDILKRGLNKHPEIREYVLQPQSDIDVLRRFIYDNGLLIVDERMLFESGKYYTLMKAVAAASVPGVDAVIYRDEADFAYGKILIDRADEVLREYLIMRREKLEEICKGISGAENIRQQERYKELMHELFIVGEILNRI